MNQRVRPVDRPLADGPALSRTVYDRAAQHRTDEDWLAAAWERAQVLALTPKSRVATAGDRIAYRAPDGVPAGAPRRFLGLVGDRPYFALTLEPDGGEWLTLRDVGAALDDLDAGLFTAAIALEQWHQRHPRCPICGTPTAETHAGWQRDCPQDGTSHFPRTDPAVIMLVHDGAGRVLLGRGHQWGEGRFSTLAGFVEPGESLESAVAREVFEEVGVQVTDVRYVASQPWPFPSSLMLGFHARLEGGSDIELDPVELAEASWFTREEVAAAAARSDEQRSSIFQPGPPAEPRRRLRGISPRLSISRYLIDLWLADG